MKNIVFLLLLTLTTFTIAHDDLHERRKIVFPNIPGYVTLKCDLHMHTVFSDGHVWPTIRVYEAVRDNLDAIAVTEHIEYQPHKKDIPHHDRNRAYQIESKTAEKDSLIVINGSEITRSMPPGHANAIFLEDANKLIVDDAYEAFEEANKQGAFVFWNHPNWTAQRKDGIATLTEMHKKLLEDGFLHGIEVVNEFTYSDEALQIALDYNLTLIGSSDIHGLIDWDYKVPEGGKRPVTLVFAKEKTKESLRDALFKRQTVVSYNNLLIGRKEQIIPLLKSSIVLLEARYQEGKSLVNVKLKNNTSTEFTLQNKSNFTLHKRSDLIKIKPLEEITLEVKTIDNLEKFELIFEVINAVIAPCLHPQLVITVNP